MVYEVLTFLYSLCGVYGSNAVSVCCLRSDTAFKSLRAFALRSVQVNMLCAGESSVSIEECCMRFVLWRIWSGSTGVLILGCISRERSATHMAQLVGVGAGPEKKWYKLARHNDDTMNCSILHRLLGCWTIIGSHSTSTHVRCPG